jgi:hypothetical protein
MKKCVFLLLFILIIYGCDTNPDPLTIDEESKAYCLFDEGTYWVYEDSATQRRDSVVVVSNPDKIWSQFHNHEGYEMKLHTYTPTDTLESYLIVMPGYLNWPEHDPSFTCGFFSIPYIYGSNPFQDIYNNPYYFMQSVHFEGDINNNLEKSNFATYRDPAFRSNDFDLRREEYYAIYSQYNIDYPEVIVTSLTQDIPSEDIISIKTLSYWAKNIGLIRFEAVTDSINIVTKLVNYNINNYEN